MAVTSKPLSAVTPGRGIGCGIAFGMLFFLVGAGIIIFAFLRPMYKIQKARGWVATPCTILSSRITESSDSDGTTYRAEISYRYDFKGQTYTGDRVTFLTVSSSSYTTHSNRSRAYPADSKRICYVNPAAPSQAVLNRDITGEIWFIGGFGAVFGGLGLAMAWGVSRRRRKAMERAMLPLSRSAIPARVPVRRIRMAALLRPATGRHYKAIFFCLFALFWNGMCWSMLWFGAMDQGRHITLCPTIFLSIFCLIGLLLIGLAIHSLLAFANPVPTLTLSDGAIALGASVTLQWKFTGRFDRITNLRISLQAEERATYTKGTTTVTDTHLFHNQELLNTVKPVEIAAGKVTIAVPADSMHSFDAANNKIVWRIRVHGEIPRWPDVKEDFVFQVLPMEIDAIPVAPVS